MRRVKEKGGLLLTQTANISTSNTTESTNSGTGTGTIGRAMTTVVLDSKDNNRASTYTSTLTSSHHSGIGGGTNTSNHYHHHSKSNPIYKQRAYLSKGVPVILYEEMSDKPLEDYDENNANITGGASRHIGNFYRLAILL